MGYFTVSAKLDPDELQFGHRPGERWIEGPDGDCPDCDKPLEWCAQVGEPPYEGRSPVFRWTRHAPADGQPQWCGKTQPDPFYARFLEERGAQLEAQSKMTARELADAPVLGVVSF